MLWYDLLFALLAVLVTVFSAMEWRAERATRGRELAKALSQVAATRDPRAERRGALYEEVQALADQLEQFGLSEGDAEVRLLGLVVRHSAFQIDARHGFADYRTRCLRDAAETVASHLIDKWWRTKDDQAAARALTLLKAGVRSQRRSRLN
jgi:hypothetical protein